MDAAQSAEHEEDGDVGCSVVDCYGGARDADAWMSLVRIDEELIEESGVGRTSRCAGGDIDVIVSCTVVADILQR